MLPIQTRSAETRVSFVSFYSSYSTYSLLQRGRLLEIARRSIRCPSQKSLLEALRLLPRPLTNRRGISLPKKMKLLLHSLSQAPKNKSLSDGCSHLLMAHSVSRSNSTITPFLRYTIAPRSSRRASWATAHRPSLALKRQVHEF